MCNTYDFECLYFVQAFHWSVRTQLAHCSPLVPFLNPIEALKKPIFLWLLTFLPSNFSFSHNWCWCAADSARVVKHFWFTLRCHRWNRWQQSAGSNWRACAKAICYNFRISLLFFCFLFCFVLFFYFILFYFILLLLFFFFLLRSKSKILSQQINALSHRQASVSETWTLSLGRGQRFLGFNATGRTLVDSSVKAFRRSYWSSVSLSPSGLCLFVSYFSRCLLFSS